jgi:hypothetical protein
MSLASRRSRRTSCLRTERHQHGTHTDHEHVERGKLALRPLSDVHDRCHQREVKQGLPVQERQAGRGKSQVGIPERERRNDHRGQGSRSESHDGSLRLVVEIQRGGHEHHDRHRHPSQIHPLQEPPRRRDSTCEVECRAPTNPFHVPKYPADHRRMQQSVGLRDARGGGEG